MTRFYLYDIDDVLYHYVSTTRLLLFTIFSASAFMSDMIRSASFSSLSNLSDFFLASLSARSALAAAFSALSCLMLSVSAKGNDAEDASVYTVSVSSVLFS